MTSHRIVLTLALASPVALALCANAQQTATQPVNAATTIATKTGVSQDELKAMEAMLKPPEPDPTATRAAMIRQYAKQIEGALERGMKLEEKHPGAENLYEVRMMMLEAAHFLAKVRQSEPAKQRLVQIAGRIVDSDAPLRIKVLPDMVRTQAKLDREALKDDQAVKQIQQFVDRYKGTDAAAGGYLYGAQLAMATGQRKLADQYGDVLEEKHLSEPGVRPFLKRGLGRSPDVGKPFEAKLTTLKGETINLPEDMKGKVVVVDFWATWCGPCIRAMPHMKRLYQDYKGDDFAMIGISLDRPGETEKLKEFIKQHKLPWHHVHAMGSEGSPLADRYGVTGIPNVWVIGKDGKVVTDSALRTSEGMAGLEKFVKKALDRGDQKERS